MMTDWYDKTIQALQLNGKGERTQEAYARSVRMLKQFSAPLSRLGLRCSQPLTSLPSTEAIPLWIWMPLPLRAS